jgi:Gpi18-like mannosyltransferase
MAVMFFESQILISKIPAMKSHKVLSGLLAFSFPCILNASVILPEYKVKPEIQTSQQRKSIQQQTDSTHRSKIHTLYALPRFNQSSN